MKGGRKNLKRAIEEESLNLEECHNIMQVLSLVVSNLVEVMDAQGKKSLALFPAKFQKSMWIKRGSFVVVDGSGREKALESRSKLACIVSKVLFCEQVRALQKSQECFGQLLNRVTMMDFFRSKPIQIESDHMTCMQSLIQVQISIKILEKFQGRILVSSATLRVPLVCKFELTWF